MTDVDDFLAKQGISSEDWARAELEWSLLEKIGADHLARAADLSECAQLFANRIQSMEWVHSVRWRVKDVAHLMEKIIRKRVAD